MKTLVFFENILNYYKKRPLLFSFLFFSVIFWLFRIPFYFDYPFVLFSNDTFEYADLAYQIKLGITPKFGYLPPLYPLFIFIVKYFFDSVLFVAFFQSLATFFAGIILIYSVSKININYSIIISLFIGLHLNSEWVMLFETAMLTDSLYSSFLIFIASFTILSLKTKRNMFLILLSVFISLALLLRPNGISMLIYSSIILVVLIYYKLKLKNILFFIFPLLMIITSVSIYNVFTLNSIIPFRYKSVYINNYYISEHFYNDINTIKPFYLGNIKKEEFLKKMKYIYDTRGITSEQKPSIDNKIKSHIGFINENNFFYTNSFFGRVLNYENIINADSIEVTKFPAPVEFTKYVFGNYYNNIPDVDFFDKKYSKTFVINNKVVKTFYLFSFISRFILRSSIWVYFLFAIILIIILKIWKIKQISTIDLIMLSLFAFYLIELFIISQGALRPLHRYSYPLEFIYYLTFTLAVFYFPKIIDLKFKTPNNAISNSNNTLL